MVTLKIDPLTTTYAAFLYFIIIFVLLFIYYFLFNFDRDNKTRYYYLLFCTVVTFFVFMIFVPATLLRLQYYCRHVITAILLLRYFVVNQYWRQLVA